MIAKSKSVFVKTITKVKSIPILMILVVIISALIRLLFLDDVPPSLFWDEISAVYVPYLHLQGVVNLAPRAVVVYVLQGTFALYNFGLSNFMVRLPAAIYGILLVITTYKLSKEMFGKRIGLLSSALIALSPWAIIFSRYQVVSSAIVFYFTFLVFLMYKGTESNKPRKRIAYFGASSIILGLLMIFRPSNAPFALLLVAGYSLIFGWMRKLKFEWRKFLYFGLILALLIACSFYLYHSQPGLVSHNYRKSTFAHAGSPPEFIKLVLERFYLHLSPDFLVFTGGFSFAVQEGFREMIASEGLLKYSTGIVGMLNYWGILIYPAIFYLSYRVLKKKNTREEKLLLWWIIAYALTSGVGYYDNPNAARNIVGLPALVIAISFFANRAYDFIGRHINETLAILFPLGIAILILAPTAYFLNDYYFGSYSTRSAKSFDYGYKEIAQFLTETDNWKRPIFLCSLPKRNWNLVFYSPQQLIEPDKFRVVHPNFNFADLSPQRAFIQIEKSLMFANGTIKYNTRIDQGYGAATSSHMQLARDENNLFALSIYTKNSTYNPNGCLVAQKVDGQVYAEHCSLKKVIEYSKWYTVELMINSTSVSFYLNNELITTWPRPTNDVYHYLRLYGESGGVSFTDFKISYSGDNKFVNLLEKDDVSDWQIISGTWAINQNILSGDAGVILIIPSALDLQLLRESNVEYEILKTIYYPAGNVAFRVLLVPP